jgi:hypothetical protein
VQLESLQTETWFQGNRFDFVAKVKIGDVSKLLLIEVRSSGQPRFLRQAIARFRETGISDAGAYFVIAAPYISVRGMEVCRLHEVGCLDLVGNFYLAFDNVYIERVVADVPQQAKRTIRNLFAPVSSRIIRVMLEEPAQSWKLTALSESAGASLGQTYNVSEKLVAEGFARKSYREGLTLTDPAGLLDLWREEYEITAGNELHSFHSSEREPAVVMREIARVAERAGSTYAFTLHAGASLVAPYVRFNDVHFYIGSDVHAWVDALGLHTVEYGGNVHLVRPYDEGVFYRARFHQGMVVVGNIQLYLDLYRYPARGREQAAFLRERELGF